MTVVNDSFTYSDGSLVTVSSSAWANRANNNFDVTSGTVAPKTPSATQVLASWEANTFGDSYAQVVLGGTIGSAQHGVGLRWNTGGTYGNFYRLIVVNSTTLGIWKRYSSAWVSTQTTGSGAAISAGDILRFEATGSTTITLTGKVSHNGGSSWETYVTLEDSTNPLATGKACIAGYAPEAVMDDFEAGDLTSTGTTSRRLMLLGVG